MTKRKTISKKTRFEVFKRDSFACQYCGQRAPDVLLHIDHITPVVSGGTNDVLNLITACVSCNQGKRDRVISDSSTVSKRMNQATALQERREQIEMVAKWQRSLADLDALATQQAVVAINRGLNRFDVHLNESGVDDISRLVRRFGLEHVLAAVRDLDGTHNVTDPGKYLDLIPKLASLNKKQETDPFAKRKAYIAGTVHNRFYNVNELALRTLLDNLVPTRGEEVYRLAASCTDWSDFALRAYALDQFDRQARADA